MTKNDPKWPKTTKVGHTMGQNDNQNTVPAIHRAIDVIEFISSSQRELSFSEIMDNVDTVFVFRLSGENARALSETEFWHELSPADLINLDKYQAFVRYKYKFWFSMFQNISVIILTNSRVDRYSNDASLKRAKINNIPFRPVIRYNSHFITFFESGGHQTITK